MRQRLVWMALVVSVVGGRVTAQTNDVFWGQWRSTEDRYSARLEALGGAGVAYTDDASAGVVNPAMLATLTRSEVLGGLATRGKANFGVIGGGGLLRPGFVLGGYVHRPVLQDSAAVPGGRYEYEITEGGGTAARQFGHVIVGGTLRVSRLAFSGLAQTTEAGGPLLVGSEAGVTRIGGTLGLAVTSNSGFTLGAAFRTADTYKATRTSQLDRLTDDPGSEYEVRRPWRLSFGATYRWSTAGQLVGQVDVRGAGLLTRVAHRAAEGATYTAEEGTVTGAGGGIEYAVALGHVSVVLRGGVRHDGEAGIVGSGDEGLYFPGRAAKTRVCGGVGVVFRGGAVDVGGSTGGVAVEARLRF